MLSSNQVPSKKPGAHIMARTIGGVVNLAPTIRDVWGFEVVTGKHSGSAMVEIDFGNPNLCMANS